VKIPGRYGWPRAVLAGLTDMRTSEDPQDKALINVTEGFTAAPAPAAGRAAPRPGCSRRPADQPRLRALGMAAGSPRRL
jgi:hypothetical protein